MKIEKMHYVLMRVGRIDMGRETEYFSDKCKNEFTNDIAKATKFGSTTAAMYAQYEFENRKHHTIIPEMHIVPVKCTYEW